MSEQEYQPTAGEGRPARTWTEAPASLTVKAQVRGRDTMLTLRGDSGADVIKSADALFDWLDKHAPTPDQRYESARNPDGEKPAAPTPAQTAEGISGQVACAMLEVGTAYKSGKTQLKFHCDGFDHPLTFTKEIGEMARLIAPLGLDASAIVVGKKYPVNAIVAWQQGEKYRNVVAVRRA